MSVERELISQLAGLYQLLIKYSFAINQNYHSEKNGLITWSNCKNISFTLRNQPYTDIYDECVKEKAYNFMLLDGALIQLMYQLEKGVLTKHRLAYLPNPHLESYIDAPEDYEEIHFGSSYFTEIQEKNSMAFPIRLDFDSDPKKFIEFEHSFVHLTLGNHPDCRIPVSRPITPNKFVLFILMSFYGAKFKEEKLTIKDFNCTIPLNFYITKQEATMVHINH